VFRAMAVAHNGYTNGVNGHTDATTFQRFSDIPGVIDIPVRGEDGDEAVNLDLTELLDETDELCDLLENENAARNYWITIALAYAKQSKVDIAVDILQKGLSALSRGRSEDRLSLLACLCWMHLWQCRHAPRVKPTPPAEDERTKDTFLHAATSTLNDASRINPSYPPLHMARGTLYLLRASLQPSRSGTGSHEHSERAETLKNAAKCFDEAYRVSQGKNVMAMLGKAKAQFSLGRYAESLLLYQQTLERAPDMIDPDPRIGIGCCLWQLHHKEHAKAAWQRSLELNQNSKTANVLLGLSYLDESSQYASSDPAFTSTYKKAMTVHTQTAFKLDAMHALTCATFGSYFVLRKAWTNVERLARRAIERTDVNAIASDGWYLLARKEHYAGDMKLAADYYSKADQARGGDDRGYLPAKFGSAQLKTLMQDLDGAKFRLEKIINTPTGKSLEAMTLLGILHAEEVFANQAAGSKEDKSVEQKKAIGLLEQIRIAWRDPKRKIAPDAAVLLNLARLYESEQPEKAVACLQQVEQMELDDIGEDDERLPDDIGDEVEERRAKRELLNPQLLNNIGCFHFQGERLTVAREDFQTALNACVKMGDRDPSMDTDALVTTLSYNLARTYEAEGLHDEARKVYTGLLDRHPDYVDANTRLAYISLAASPTDGAEAIKQLMASDPANLEVRSLYGWYINKHKKRTPQLNEDQEQRHYKQTLQAYDKHDVYSLTGMGNLHLAVAREMRRETDQDKERRSKTYMRAVEFFDKVLTLDPKNAFAAQGLGIAMVEEKKDTATGIQIFAKVRESIKSASPSVHVNLGHVFADVKQYSRSIENYELALAKDKTTGPDPQILACLGRVWLMRGRQEKKLEAYKTSLDFSKQALQQAPDNISFRFNVAFVQIQLAQLLISLPEAQRTSADVDAATQGLDDAIQEFTDIAKSPNPPYPRDNLDARANMGRNTMKRQLAAAAEKQAEYERKNATRLEEARRRREDEIRKREEEKQAAAEKLEEQRQKIKQERERMAEEDRALISRRMEEEKAKEEAEFTTDADTGEKKRREKRAKGEKRAKRKKKGDESDSEVDGVEGATDVEVGKTRRSRATSGTPGTGSEGGDAAPRRKKKRKLERKGQMGKSGKYKSTEMVEDSSDDDDAIATQQQTEADAGEDAMSPGAGMDEEMVDGGEDDGRAAAKSRKKTARILDDEDDEDDGEVGGANAAMEDEDTTAAGDANHGGSLVESSVQ